MTSKRNPILLFILLLALIVPSHLIANDRTVTVDEPWWVISGSNYYYALTHRDFADTIYDYHPAVTTTWMVTAGMVSYFPEYRGFGLEYFDVRKPNFEEFLRENCKEALGLLRNSRLFQSALILALAALCFFLLQKLIDYRMAFLSITLAMTAPFFLGHARLLNHEGMLSIFVLTSFLGMQVYINKERKSIYLLISGAAFGLAQLTKSSSIVVLGVVGLMLLIDLIKNKNFSVNAVLSVAGNFALWLATAALIYFILWPGMWVAPLKMLEGVYGNAFSYAFQGARLDVTEELQPASFSLSNGFEGILLYLKNWVTSTTFVTWLGLIFASFIVFSKDKERLPAPVKSTLGYLFLIGGLFIVLFGIAQGRNSQHYILSSYVCFDVMAGIGWGYVLMLAQGRWAGLRQKAFEIGFLALLTITQIGIGLPYAPYYFTYKNPFASQAATYGYGEGLAEASDYLSAKPNAQELRVYAYNGMGTFSFFFPGETVVFKRVHLIEEDFITITDELRNSDYLVLYPIVREKQPETEKIFRVLEGVVEPEKVISINGLEYIRIYAVAEIPESVFESLLGK
ncbi:MAG: glycosyltransferase family 39 protein [Anaerolineales bacterium]|nr:glycosyltransferase family 39 protein [Anaerolineales bacterium]